MTLRTFTLLTALTICSISMCGQTLNYKSVTYFGKDFMTGGKTEETYGHEGTIKILEDENKITRDTRVYRINSKEAENDATIYYCTGMSDSGAEVPMKIEYDSFWQRVKIGFDDKDLDYSYTIYFIEK